MGETERERTHFPTAVAKSTLFVNSIDQFNEVFGVMGRTDVTAKTS